MVNTPLAATITTRLLFSIQRKEKGDRFIFSGVLITGFALTASYFLFACAKRK
jgi:hypothetical protein